MAIKTFGDLKKHLHHLDTDPLVKRLAAWLDERIKQMPGDVVALNLEWDLVGGEADNDEVVGDLFGYQSPGLDPATPDSWDWSSGDHGQFQFLGLGAIWSEAVEALTDDEVPEVEVAVTGTIDAVVRNALTTSHQFSKRNADGQLKFYWARHMEPLREFAPSSATA